MRRSLHLGTLLLALFAASVAEARVFSFATENFAAYLRGGGGLSRLSQDAFANSSGTQTLFSDESVLYNFSGEFGFLYAMGPLKVRLGIEGLRPKELETTGKNSGGLDLLTVNSSVFVFSPMLTFEYVYSQLGNVQFYGFVGGGYADVTVDNEYEMAAQGLVTYNPVVTHTEKSSATGYPVVAGMGFETLFVDNVTFSMDAGYRYFKVDNLKYKADVTTLTGTVQKGQPVRNHDGSNRQLDLGGFMINASFKFYISF